MRGCCAGTCSGAWDTSKDCAPPACSASASTPASATDCGRRSRRSIAAGCRSAPTRRTCTPRSRAWLTRRLPGLGERLHTGRSRNDQVACDLRLYLKDRLLALHAGALELSLALLAFAARHQRVLWPGYTHQRRAMPSSVGLWAGAYAEGLLDTVESLEDLWPRLDRSPLGSAAGYGVPLPLRREVAAKALGFAGLDRNVATVQGGRGKLEAAALFWCTQLGHELARLSQDVILYSAEEFGYLTLPPELVDRLQHHAAQAEPRSLRAHPRPRRRARGRPRRGAPAQVQALQRLPPRLPAPQGAADARPRPHRGDAGALAAALPLLGVDRDRCAAALDGGSLATDEVMRRVEDGQAFRVAYREVKAALARGDDLPSPSSAQIVSRRRSTGGLGDLGLAQARARARRAARWNRAQRQGFTRALTRLAGRGLLPVRPAARQQADAMTADRRKRHLKILELISTRAIHTQEELAEALAAAGWDVTQSSVSRDIAALRLVKVDGAYRRPPRGTTTQDPDERRIAEGVLTSEPAGDALVVLHTPPGEANRVGSPSTAWPGPTSSAPSPATTRSSWPSKTSGG